MGSSLVLIPAFDKENIPCTAGKHLFTIIDGGYSFLKTMDLQQSRDLKNPVVLHYAGRYKPWKAEIKSFFTFDLYRRYYKTVTQDF